MSIAFSFLANWLALSFLVSTAVFASPPNSPNFHDISKKTQSRLFQNKVVVVSPKPKFWEIQHQGEFQNRGIARIDKLGNEYVLTVFCKGVHRVFIHQHKKINLEEFLGQFVQVQYTYGDVKKQVRCIKAPCNPITERKLIIQDLEIVLGSEEMRAQFETQCQPYNR